MVDRPALSREQLVEFQIRDIPYRVGHIRGLIWWLYRVQSGTGAVGVDLYVDGRYCKPETLTNAVVDAGLVACRMLATFMGINLSRDATTLGRVKARGEHDLYLEHFDEAILTSDQLSDSLRDELTPDDYEALRFTLEIANKAAVHMTRPRATDGFEPPEIEKLMRGGEIVIGLLEVALYQRLQLPNRGNFPYFLD